MVRPILTTAVATETRRWEPFVPTVPDPSVGNGTMILRLESLAACVCPPNATTPSQSCCLLVVLEETKETRTLTNDLATYSSLLAVAGL
jgi:hypothetical protein